MCEIKLLHDVVLAVQRLGERWNIHNLHQKPTTLGALYRVSLCQEKNGMEPIFVGKGSRTGEEAADDGKGVLTSFKLQLTLDLRQEDSKR
jgi:hypothetical protein